MASDNRPVESVSLKTEIIRLLAKHGLSARKGLGQNFLIDRGVLDKIIRAADVGPDDTVVEVGPGPGVLTAALAERAGKVIAVELDSGMVDALRETVGQRPNVSIISGDILDIQPEELVENGPYKLVANLPYYITSPVLRHFLESPNQPSSLTVMVQKEVARQIIACPPEMSLLALGVQFFGKPRIVGNVSAGCFYPAPKVASTILNIEVFSNRRLALEREGEFFRLARAGFGTRRKQLANALAGGLNMDKDTVIGCLKQAGIAPERRAETLTIEEWMALLESWGSGDD